MSKMISFGTSHGDYFLRRWFELGGGHWIPDRNHMVKEEEERLTAVIEKRGSQK